MFRQNLGLKILAVGIACLFWVQTVLLKEHITVVKLPVVLANLPQQMTLTKLPASIPFQVKGRGFEILKLKLYHIQAEVDAHDMQSGSGSISQTEYKVNLPVYIHVEILGPVASENLPFESDYLRKVSLPVQPDFADVEARTLFYEKNFRLRPDKVEVQGPENLLKTLHFIQTKPLTIGQLAHSSFKLKLVPPADDVLLSERIVDISQSSEQLVTRLYSQVPIQTDNGVSVFPVSVTIRVRGQAEALRNLTTDRITVRLRLTEAADNQIPLQIILPTGVELIEYTPEKVTRLSR